MRLASLLGVIVALALGLTGPGLAQEDGQPPPFKPEEIEQLVAPVALYPDSLLAQVFMASTYPLEVVEAARWAKANPKVTGEALEAAMQAQPWDASVKSLTAFPQVLTMMDEKLDWTQKLGDAFLAQQPDVLAAVQRLRAKAHESGNLQSTEQQTVTVEPPSGSSTTVIQIEQADPQVVYVPTYNPTVVYGAWPYPAYPPYTWYPAGYVATSMISFGVGMAVGSALWGDCDWGGGDVDIDVNNYNNFNKTDIRNNKWEHNAEHRKGVQYRDQASRNRYNKGTSQGAASREAFRGRAEQGRQSLPKQSDRAQGGTGQRADAGRRADAGQRGEGAARDRAGQERPGGRDVARSHDRPPDRPRHEGVGHGRQPNAFKDIGNGAATRQASDRGRVSRQSAQQYGGGGRAAGGRGGGGGGRGGGGGGRGGGGGGRGGGRRGR